MDDPTPLSRTALALALVRCRRRLSTQAPIMYFAAQAGRTRKLNDAPKTTDTRGISDAKSIGTGCDRADSRVCTKCAVVSEPPRQTKPISLHLTTGASESPRVNGAEADSRVERCGTKPGRQATRSKPAAHPPLSAAPTALRLHKGVGCHAPTLSHFGLRRRPRDASGLCGRGEASDDEAWPQRYLGAARSNPLQCCRRRARLGMKRRQANANSSTKRNPCRLATACTTWTSAGASDPAPHHTGLTLHKGRHETSRSERRRLQTPPSPRRTAQAGLSEPDASTRTSMSPGRCSNSPCLGGTGPKRRKASSTQGRRAAARVPASEAAAVAKTLAEPQRPRSLSSAASGAHQLCDAGCVCCHMLNEVLESHATVSAGTDHRAHAVMARSGSSSRGSVTMSLKRIALGVALDCEDGCALIERAECATKCATSLRSKRIASNASREIINHKFRSMLQATGLWSATPRASARCRQDARCWHPSWDDQPR